MAQLQERVQFLLERLVDIYVPAGDDSRNTARTHAYRLAAHMLESRLQPSISADENAVSEQIKRKCMIYRLYQMP